MAYSTDDIKALAAILKPIIKSALESGSTGVGDLEVVTSLDLSLIHISEPTRP